MLSLQDVIDYCDADNGEIEAIAEHEHVPMAVAAEIGSMLLCSPEGVCRLRAIIIENMQNAVAWGRYQHAKDLAKVYRHLQRSYPLPGESCPDSRQMTSH
ncbi:MAG: hypothetical protein FWF20_04395 [Betaproteobacteria bacterium]|nr:hypothetical protein [Betaproteobacteria bacterium]MCL2886018.1 hypothetical protein [Betaproteobacteria bacterium]